MNPRIRWEAATCTNRRCRGTVVHKLHGDDYKLHEDGRCPLCEQSTLRLVRNASLLAQIVHATINAPRGATVI